MRVVKKGILQVPQIGKKIVPAECAILQEEIDRLYTERRDFYFEYKILHDKILYGKNQQTYRKSMDEKIEEINRIQDKIDALHEYFESLEQMDPSGQLAADIAAEKKRSIATTDPVVFVRSMKRLHALESELNKQPSPIDYVVYKIPGVSQAAADAEHEKVREVPLVKPKRGKALPDLTKSDLKAIKDNIKELIKEKFKPKTVEECSSQKRSQPYYMKKDDILTTIESNPQIKQVLPENYKSLNKEELCKHLFN
jgi:hypothetical protein